VSVSAVVIWVVVAALVGVTLYVAPPGLPFLRSGGLVPGPLHTPTPSPTPVVKPRPPSYRVTFDTSAAPGAATPAPVDQVIGEPLDALPYATADGLRFLGWFTDPADPAATQVDNATLGRLATDADTTLYARYEPRPAGVDYNSPGLPILMYHYFYDPRLGETGENGNWMDIRLFEDQVRWLTENNYYFPTWEEADLYLRGEAMIPQPAIILTSDDGLPSFFDLAIPVVVKYGARMTGFVVVGYFDRAHLEENREFIDYQSHSWNMHPGTESGQARLPIASAEEIREDVELSADALGTRLAFCYPYGYTTPFAEEQLAANGVRLGLVIENLTAYPMMPPLHIPRLRMSDGISLDTFIWVVTSG
jgi:peptidoglycan/xylan/chitin deacetylase (PgdA/CDA1 family)